MSKIKRDLMKEIEAKVARKKKISKQVSQQKTIAKWVADFFVEYEKTKRLDEGQVYHAFAYLALDRLSSQLQAVDRKCHVYLAEDSDPPTVEIRWTPTFISANNCEEVLVFDASSALFQSAMEEI